MLQDLLEKQQEEAENALNDLKEKHAGQVESLNTKLKRLQKQVEEAGTLKSLTKEQYKSIEARIKHKDVGYSLIQTDKGELQWFKDSQVINLQELFPQHFKACQQVNYSTVFADNKRLED